MKSKNLIIGLACLLSLVVVLSMSTKSQKPEEQPKFETIVIGTGGAPKWSPDGTRLAFLSGGWLCVANADGKGEIQKIAQLQFNSFDWMSDSAFVVTENIPWTPEGKGRGHRLAIRSVDMNGQIQTIREDSIIVVPQSEYLAYGSVPVILNDGTVGYYEIHEKPEGETKIFKIIKQGKLEPDSALKQMIATTEGYPGWGEIWLESADLTIRKRITPDKKYLFPKLSPDGTKILACYGPADFVLDLEGNVILDLGKDLPKVPPGYSAEVISGALHGIWSPDSRRIVYEIVFADGHTTYDKDIYMVNVDGTERVAIAVTPAEKEGGASWSPDGTKIAYFNGTTGKIYVVKIK
jgi:Tol biopolymer transport system component